MQKLIVAAALILGGLIAAPQAAAQSCRVFNTCPPAPAPKKPPRKPQQQAPQKPPQQPQQRRQQPQQRVATPSRCDLMWANTVSSGDGQQFVYFSAQCPTHARAAEARARADAIAADRAAKDRACETRLGTLTGGASVTSAAVSAFAAECPAAAAKAEYAALRDRVLTRERLDAEARRWGLTYREMCSLRGTELLAKVNLPARRLDINLAASNGDSVASLILGFDAYLGFAAGQRKYEDSVAHYLTSSKGGNPRGMVEYAATLNEAVEPDYKAIDDLLTRSRSSGCARASQHMAYRQYYAAENSAPKPRWDTSLSAPVLLREALAGGVGQAACNLVLFSYDHKLLRWRIGRAEREALYRDAGLAGSRCGEIALIEEGGKSYSGGTPFGPCATDNYACMRTRLRALRDRQVPGAGAILFGYLTGKSVGGSGTVTAEAFAAIEQDAKLGESGPMVGLGLLKFKGEGTTADTQAALDWCYRAAVQGNGVGDACVGILGKDSSRSIQTAYKRDPCAPYQAAVSLMPSFESRKGPDLALAVKALPRARKASLKSILPKIRLALNETAKSSASCGADARAWQSIIEAYVAPHV